MNDLWQVFLEGLSMFKHCSRNWATRYAYVKDTASAKEIAESAKNSVLQQLSMRAQVVSKKTSDAVRSLLSGYSFVHKQNFLN